MLQIIPEWEDINFWLVPLNALFGAGLGASFYILLNTQSYLSTRSFDPKYNGIYVARFITGLIAGIILSTALRPFVMSLFQGKNEYSFAPGVLAILGGYAAEAVQQILQRLVEILMTAVRGDGSAQAQGAAKSKQADQNNKIQQLLVDYEREPDPARKKTLLNQTYQLLSS